MINNFTYEFQPDYEQIQVIGLSGTGSSERNDGIALYQAFEAAALQGLKHIREDYPSKYKNGLRIYIGEHNDHLWLGFNNPGTFLADIFINQLKKNLPKEQFIIEQIGKPQIPMRYSYYPDRIFAFGKDKKNGEAYKDQEYGTLLELIPSELFLEDMRNFL